LSEVFSQITQNNWRQEVTLGVNRLGGSLLPDIDPRIMSLLELFTFRYNGRKDISSPTQVRRLDSLGINLAVTPLADIIIYSEPSLLALSVPQVADYFITLDPRRVTQAWDGSLLGHYFFPIDGIILEEPFYDYFTRILFPEREAEKHERSSLMQHILLLNEGTEFFYEGTSLIKINGEMQWNCDVYRIVITQEAVNTFWQAVRPSFTPFPDDLIGDILNEQVDIIGMLQFESGLDIEMYVYDRKVAGAKINTQISSPFETVDAALHFYCYGDGARLDSINASLYINHSYGGISAHAYMVSDFGNPNVLLSETSLSVLNTYNGDSTAFSINWDIRWDKRGAGDNFSLQAGLDLPGFGQPSGLQANVTASGAVMGDAEREYLDINLKNAALNLTSPWGALETSLSARYILRPDNETLSIEGQGQVPLTGVTELDVLLMFGRLMNHPTLSGLLGDMLGGLLPF
jgi:hypothetical protein